MFHLRHPRKALVRAECGFDPTRGYFVDVVEGDLRVPYDAGSVEYDDDRPLRGALVCLSSFGFVAGADVDDALECSQSTVPSALPSGGGALRRALRLIRRFKEEGRRVESGHLQGTAGVVARVQIGRRRARASV